MADRVIKVLMVDDSDTQYSMVVDFLYVAKTDSVEYTVDWASTYKEGIEKLESNTYHVGLIDYELGDENGLDFISYAVKHNYGLPMILLTSHGNHHVDLQAMKAGAVDYLDKTLVKPNSLERSIRYATENQRMVERERKQREFAEALLDTAHVLNSSLEFDDVLDRILTNMQSVIPHDSANILLVDAEHSKVVGSHGYAPEYLNMIVETLERNTRQIPIFQEMLDHKQPIFINNTLADEKWIKISGVHVQSYLGVPIIIHEEVIGFLNFDGYEMNKFTDEHVHYAQIFAQQAAQAIRNTQAYKQALALAATQERQRLARDLHDAVSQTLFSASVIAQTLPRLLDHSPEDVKDGLDELNRLNRGALAEMRTLLVELRPQTLAEMDLPTLIRNLIHAFNSHSEVEINSRINNITDLPEDVHIAFYRIAQEALNNIRKYAKATQVNINFLQHNHHIELQVIDNGIGFDPSRIPPGHLGLKIMKERASDINADLNVSSVVGEGTSVELIWNMNDEGTNDD